MIPKDIIRDFKSGLKNSVSLLHEYSSQMRLPLQFKEEQSGLQGKFCTYVQLGNIAYDNGYGINKKASKIEAAKHALAKIIKMDEETRGAYSKKNMNLISKQNEQLSMTTVLMQNENNPIWPLTQYCHRNNLGFEILADFPITANGFKAEAIINGNSIALAYGQSKKSARAEVCNVVLNMLMSYDKLTQVTDYGNHFDKITRLVRTLFNNLTQNYEELKELKSTSSAFIIKRDNDSDGEVVTLAAGSYSPDANAATSTLDGKTLNDCHSLVLARRGLVLYMYNQIRIILLGHDKSSIFEFVKTSDPLHRTQPLRLKSHISIHLYMSAPPCGDARNQSETYFTRLVTDEELRLITDGRHLPVFKNDTHGLLSCKNLGLATTSTHCCDLHLSEKETNPCIDDLKSGKQNMETMSCSDKLLKMNVLGVQGSMLSSYVGPIYINSITIGHDFIHGDLSRALCCRVNDNLFNDSKAYHLNHPYIGRPSYYDTKIGTNTSKMSFNYVSNESSIEIIDSSTGFVDNETKRVSRLSKYANVSRFGALFKTMIREKDYNPFGISSFKTPEDVKSKSTEYETNKLKLYDYLYLNDFGSWVKKPVEFETFTK